jgi:glycosyltransferase involved in cell wall biosynthesis
MRRCSNLKANQQAQQSVTGGTLPDQPKPTITSTSRTNGNSSRAVFSNSGCLVSSQSIEPALAGCRNANVESLAQAAGIRTISPPVAPTDFDPLTILIATPTLQAGAADAGVVELTRVLASAGHEPIVVSRGGRLTREIHATGATCIELDMASHTPVTMLRNAFALKRIVHERRCNIIHAHARAPAWSACLASRMTGVPFVTTWYKGFREQNAFKRVYNGVMARGAPVIAVSDQIAELINDRYGTPWSRIAVVPLSIDTERFDPGAVSRDRVMAIRRLWGIRDGDRIVLVTGRMLRRKGHHLVVQAVEQLKAMGLKDFVVVFAAEDQGTRYAGEIWDRVLATGSNDIIRMSGPIDDLPAAYAASTVIVSAAVQPEGVQRAILEAQAMERPVIVSDLAADPDTVLAAPAVANERITGLRVAAGDAGALAAALVRLFSMPEAEQQAIGTRGRAWVRSHFNAEASAALILKLYSEAASRQKAA